MQEAVHTGGITTEQSSLHAAGVAQVRTSAGVWLAVLRHVRDFPRLLLVRCMVAVRPPIGSFT